MILRLGIRSRLHRRVRRLRRRRREAARELNRLWQRRYRRSYSRRLDRVTTREELPVLLNVRGLTGLAAEIGVKRGVYSEHLLRWWEGARLISVDHWSGEHARFLTEATDRLAPFGARSEVWRMTSEEAAALVEDGTLDFVYIDAAHDADSVGRDLEAWFPKVRSGGILAGHDYVPDSEGYGVRTAVDSFFAERGIRVETTRGVVSLETHPSWIVEIPAAGAEGGR